VFLCTRSPKINEPCNTYPDMNYLLTTFSSAKWMYTKLCTLFFLLVLLGCSPTRQMGAQDAPGTLFIIGGGKRPPALIRDLVTTSGLDEGGYAIILPMASGEPDTAAYYGMLQFEEAGIPSSRLSAMHFQREAPRPAMIDSLAGAQLIYITGGDQNRFMKVVEGTDIQKAIQQAYQQGATIAGTSAGAAMMSQRMITGNEFKHPEYTGDFRTIEAENLEYKNGLGLLPDAIIDQHFIYRMRMNRLMAAALEHPGMLCIGIDESTAIVVQGNQVRVVGESQVVTVRNNHPASVKDGLLGGQKMELSVYLPGDQFMR
jgi:cyanophycinase